MLKAAAVFSDHMVLQRNKKICVFGQGTSHRKITVSFSGSSASALCRNGKWIVYLPEHQAADNLTMEITDGEESISFTDIAIGEVWLAGGQSNMELELQNADGGQDILKQEYEKQVRFYYTPKLAYKDANYEQEIENSHWELFNSKDAAKWSAVGFFFARKLAGELNVTVGVIGCNRGGTSASCWMSREALLEQEATRSYVEEYEASPNIHKSEEEQIKDYQDYQVFQQNWDNKAAAIYEKEPMMPFDKVQELIGTCQYPGPMNCANFTRPAGLYETMLKNIMPYTLSGFIFYQGETDENKPNSYYALFSRMIQLWREDFGDDTLPFIFVQLPMHRYQHDPDTKSWCILREAQMKAYKTIRNTGIAVAIDCGQFHEIHPKNKKPVGERLALQALAQVYKVISLKQAFGPLYKDFLYRDGGMEITFDYAEEGLKYIGEKPAGFEMAGEDGLFKEADASFIGNKVFLKAAEVNEPVKARYLWTNYREVNIFGINGLPMAPFRTHTF